LRRFNAILGNRAGNNASGIGFRIRLHTARFGCLLG
jgi:hypothetical protein